MVRLFEETVVPGLFEVTTLLVLNSQLESSPFFFAFLGIEGGLQHFILFTFVVCYFVKFVFENNQNQLST
jgi:hypothetical protein